MDSSSNKHYHEEEFDPVHFFDSFHSSEIDKLLLEETTMFPLMQMKKVMSPGHIRGDILIDLSIGPNLSHLFPIYEFFIEIIVIETNELCIKEVKKWISSDPSAIDWSHASKMFMELEGNSDGWKEKEDALRNSIKRVQKCDFNFANPTDPVVLPKADCLLNLWTLDVISKDKKSFIANLKKCAFLLKLGGHIIFTGDINVTFYKVAGHTFHILTYDEEFLKHAFNEAGFCIDYYHVLHSKAPTDLSDYEQIVFIKASKKIEL